MCEIMPEEATGGGTLTAFFKIESEHDSREPVMKREMKLVQSGLQSQAAKRIIWAVDPFAKEKKLQKSAARTIKSLISSSGAIIEPVYFLRSPLLDGTREMDHAFIEKAQKEGQKELNQILAGLKLSGVRRLRIIPAPHSYLREGVERITRLAKKWKADLVVTSTHGHKGLKHLALGSFAETLLLYSDVPLLFVNPHLKTDTKNKTILFPTDFSLASKLAFEEVLKVAKATQRKIVLFHKVLYTWPPTVKLSSSAYPLYKKAFEDELEFRRKEAGKWVDTAKTAGVMVDVVIDHKRQGSIAELILAENKKYPGLIAMAARSGPIKTALLGSTIRAIVRNSSEPVWVLHPSESAISEEKRPLYKVDAKDIEQDLRSLP